ncbi:phosphoribosyltransferase [Microvirga alba]|nr:phosphoribosyltransferase [Microvirga alba]
MQLPNPVVLALPRGGVPVGFEIAKALKAPLDLLLVRKIGLPAQPELAAAAVVDGERMDIVLNEEVVSWAGLDNETIEALARKELKEIERRRKAYLSNRPAVSVAGHTVIVVDDGIATGTTVRAALKALAKRGAKHLVLAVPVAPTDTVMSLRGLVDDVVCLATPQTFFGIGEFYRDFHQLSDEEVLHYLRNASTLSGTDEMAR